MKISQKNFCNEQFFQIWFKNFLQAKEDRLNIQKKFLNSYQASLITISLNIPGRNKNKKIYYEFFNKIVKVKISQFFRDYYIFPQIIKIQEIIDFAGNYLIVVLKNDQYKKLITLKKQLLLLELREISFMFVDIDIINSQHQRIERSLLKAPLRRCYLCHNAAKLCVKNQSHLLKDLLYFVEKKMKFFLLQNECFQNKN